ncbi:hypothetical protein HMPREF1985_00971 [Mitsuokella sp. oral taxon 131 str. W9106]|nr:hypothetical protein HMPREF1985_00971 [Mitsuokella sp. oral taxon 131 str. W9106]
MLWFIQFRKRWKKFSITFPNQYTLIFEVKNDTVFNGKNVRLKYII